MRKFRWVVVVARTANRAEQPKSNAPVALAANINDDDAFFDSLLRPLKRSAFSSSDKEEDEKGSEEGTAPPMVRRVNTRKKSLYHTS